MVTLLHTTNWKLIFFLGNIFPAVKRDAEPMILEVQPGTDLHEPVRMDAFGNTPYDTGING